jgi:hypothetical protein
MMDEDENECASAAVQNSGWYLLDSGRAGGIMQMTGNQPEAVQ